MDLLRNFAELAAANALRPNLGSAIADIAEML
jgi:hypothetical protein